MNLYAETSAVLSWLLTQDAAETAKKLLGEAEAVYTSELTLLECHRVMTRLLVTGEVEESLVADRRAELEATAQQWGRLDLTPSVLDRARRPFPEEPIRALDALHLASALALREAQPGLGLLSLDRRVRHSGIGLGFEVLPN